MLDINGNHLAKGTIVKLLNPDTRYTLGDSNPAVGTSMECEGVVVDSDAVVWDNGHRNSYKDGELASSTPYIDIWCSI